MGELAKASFVRLKELSGEKDGSRQRWEPDGKPIAVQLNPTSIRFQRTGYTDRNDSEATTRGQKRQFPASNPATLSFDLEFDTADEGTTEAPLNVLKRTAFLRQFVEPPLANVDRAPARARFHWGTMVFDGIVTQVNEDVDYFASDGTPLRAKVSISMTEQKLEFENQVGARTPTEGAKKAGFSVGAGASRSAADGVGVSAGLFASAGISASFDSGSSAGLSGTVGIGGAAGISGTVGLSGQVGFSAVGGVGVGVGVNGAAGGVAGFSLGASGAAGARLSGGFEGALAARTTPGAVFGASAAAAGQGGLQAGASAQASASISGTGVEGEASASAWS